ncbi:MAG: HAD family phosphatase [Eubacterium sp.]|nr:HAD family phosphatase [Candidatus Colimonas fimequi]
MNNKQNKVIVFDMDGVIFDSERATLACWADVAVEYGLEEIEDTYMKTIGVTKEASRQIVLDAYGQDFDYDEFEAKTIDLYYDRYSGGRMPMKPGVNELLAFLAEDGWTIGLASSTRKSIVVSQLRDAGLLDYFTEIITGDMVERSKPNPDIYLAACSALGVAPADAYAVEDSFNGIRAAYSAGMKPIMVPDILGPDDEMHTKAVQIFEDLLQVRDYLQEM